MLNHIALHIFSIDCEANDFVIPNESIQYLIYIQILAGPMLVIMDKTWSQ